MTHDTFIIGITWHDMNRMSFRVLDQFLVAECAANYEHTPCRIIIFFMERQYKAARTIHYFTIPQKVKRRQPAAVSPHESPLETPAKKSIYKMHEEFFGTRDCITGS